MPSHDTTSSTRPSAWRVVATLARDSAGPGGLAGAYAWWSHHGATPMPWPLIVKDFSLAYFFLMWFVGQYLRALKHLEDKSMFRQLSVDVAVVREVIEKRNIPTERQTITEQLLEIVDPVARELVKQSGAALDAGMAKSGLLTLARAFEHSLRYFAAHKGVARATSLPVSQLLDLLTTELGESVTADMRGVWLARHALLLLGDDEPVQKEEAWSMANAFLWATRLLNVDKS